MGGIFKAYDIRGIYGETLTEEMARDIGRGFCTFLGCKKVVVGRDIRVHSDPLFKALCEGITMQGADVVDIGVCSTPMSYFANGSLGADGSIMITASHNPAEWNGFKLCQEKAIPLSGPTGIEEIEKIVTSRSFAPCPDQPGKVTSHDTLADYREMVLKRAELSRPVRIAVDFANAMGIVEAKCLPDSIEIDPLFDDLDGRFPNHEANPLKPDTMADLQAMVLKGGHEFGVAFDGDADRAGFVDEKGRIIPMDVTTALIAKSMLAKEKGPVLYDLRSSWAVAEVIKENGGEPIMSRVGHAFIKRQMREADSVFAGELSGHYYFRDNYYCESSAMAVLMVANLVSSSGKTLSELIAPIQRYSASGEINSEVDSTSRVLDLVRDRYSEGRVTELDGVTVEFDDWWFNVRASNTEPLLRLNLEAKDSDMMATRRDELLGIIRG